MAADHGSRRDFTPVLADIAAARGLANAWYTDIEAFAEEQARVFGAGWVAAAFAHEAAEPGDVLPLEIAGTPIVLVRGADGALRGFHNVCSHRGRRLVDTAKRVRGNLACPYHSWTYGLDGGLKATPHIGGPGVHTADGFDPACHGLKPVATAEWMGLAFVDLSGEAGPFHDRIARLAGRWKDFDGVAPIAGGPESAFGFELACNWKLAVENYCEAYHLPAVHPGLNRYSRLEDHANLADADGGFAGQISHRYAPALAGDGRSFPAVAGLDPYWMQGAEYAALFPNAMLGIHRDHFFAVLVEPLAPDRTAERAQIFYFDPEAATGDAYAELRRANAELWRQVFAEDVGAVEGMQQGRRSPAFDGGVFSAAMDGPTHAFHRWVAGRLASGAA